MHRGMLGKKLGMATLFSSEGVQIPVTVLEVGPCIVTQIKTQTTDGYNAVQVGFVEKRSDRVNKALTGHFKKSGGKGYAVLAEIPVDDPAAHQLGESLTVDAAFKIGERVNVSGLTKGRGFSGVVKRWGFKGGKATHGSMFHRAPGSIGSSAWPSHVVKGRRMAGHYGQEKVTVQNMEVIDIRPDENIMIVKGAVPGCKTCIVEVLKPKTALKKK